MYDIIIIGAGPVGLSLAIAASKRNLNYLVLEKGLVVDSIYQAPTNMIYFSSAPELEIGGIPFISSHFKPTRAEALHYYRRVVAFYNLNVQQQITVTHIVKDGPFFSVQAGDGRVFSAKFVILATGYFDHPKQLGVPGEDLPKVSHRYIDSHPYFKKKVAIVGGRNSAVDAALEIYRTGGEVTLVHRKPELDKKIKYWLRPDLENRIARGEIKAFFNTHVVRIDESSLTLAVDHEKELSIENDHVLILIGYRPETRLMTQLGVKVDPETLVPSFDDLTLETNVDGFYIAGTLIAGIDTNKVFIENGKLHGEIIISDIAKKLTKA